MPGAASAHIVKGESIGFVSGFRHRISGWDHVIAMGAVALWAPSSAAPAIWLLAATFSMVAASITSARASLR